MKPLFLSIEGLQSFQEKQSIDFEKIGRDGLFGIFGPTGSGKSTIIDGMTLALYGSIVRFKDKASETKDSFDIEAINKNSDSACVNFKFKVGENVYRAERTYKIGKKSGKINKTAVLFKTAEDGSEIKIAENYKDIYHEIKENILGLTLEDFTRSVVLPQGNFSQFLKLDGKEKRDMLERIFNLEKYGDILSKKANSCKYALENKMKELDIEISSIGFNEEELVLKEAELEKAEKELSELKIKENEVKEKISEMEEIEKLEIKLSDLNIKKSELDSQKEEIEKLEEKTALSEKFIPVIEKIHKRTNYEEKLSELNKDITEIQKNFKIAEVMLKAEQEKYNELESLEAKKEEEKEENYVSQEEFLKISAILNPIVIALAGAGMIKALLVILTTTLGILDTSGSTYKILSAAGNSVFYFLPLFLAYSSAKAFKCNPYIALAIVATLMEPNFTKLMTKPGDITSFLGIPVVLMGYAGSLVPAIVAVLVYSKLEKILKKFIPKNIELFALSFVALLIMVPLTIIVIGPIGVYLADAVGNIVNFLSIKNGLLTGAVIGAGWTFLVMLGVQWGVVPIMINNISTYGYDVIRPMVAAATFASAGAAFGVFLKAKNKENKAYAFSATIPALLGGVTEPIVYGISLKYRKPFIAQIIGGAVAGGFMGMMHTKAIVYVFPALTTLPAFLGETFIYYVIGISLAFVITAVITFILGIDEDNNEETADKKDEKIKSKENEEIKLKSCIEGEAINLATVNDEAFSSEAMGKGLGIIPKKGILYAPADGEISTVFVTGHAVGMITEEGTEVLMHIGINTVEMKGDGFIKKVEDGQKVKTGDILVEFDLDKIIKAGYEPTTIMIISNTEDYSDVETIQLGEVTNNTDVLKIRG